MKVSICLTPYNRYGLSIDYKIVGRHGCTIDIDDAKVHIAKKGKYEIIASFKGNDTYRATSASYWLVYGEDLEGNTPTIPSNPDDPDDPSNPDNPNNPDNIKSDPKLSFNKSNVRLDKINTNQYEIQQVNNPYSVPIVWTCNKGNISNNTLTYDGDGDIIITATGQETTLYKSQSVSYLLTIINTSKEDPELSFEQAIVTKAQVKSKLYDIQQVTNPHNVEVTYSVNRGTIQDGQIYYLPTGSILVTVISKETDIYKAQKVSYTLIIEESNLQSPNIEFVVTQETKQEASNHLYPIQRLLNPNSVPVVISTNKGNIIDDTIYFEGTGDIVITATSEETDEYYSETSTYILYIIEASKQSPNISFDYSSLTVRYDISNEYDGQIINNPNNVEIDYSVNDGAYDKTTNKITTTAKNKQIVITAISQETETYKSECVRYTMNIYESLKNYPNFKVHEDYNITDKLNKDIEIELLRWSQTDNLVFDSSDWTISTSTYKLSATNLNYQEEGDDYVLKCTIKGNAEGLTQITINFKGNSNFNSSKNSINVQYNKKILLSPEISFPSSYVTTSKASNNQYVIQDVENPHNVPVSFYVSNGVLTGNILTYSADGDIIVTCTSEETDEYESSSINYTIHILPVEKPSPELSFTNSLVVVTEDQYTSASGHYELQSVNNPHNVPIQGWTATGSALVWPSDNEIEYHYIGEVTVSVTSRETSEYRSETVFYTFRVDEAASKVSPELSFTTPYVETVQREDGQYEIQSLNNPHGVQVTWSVTLGSLDSDTNPTKVYIDGLWTISVRATSVPDATYKQETASYTLKIKEPSSIKEDPMISFTNPTVYSNTNSQGVYPLQMLNNPNNVVVHWSLNNSNGSFDDPNNPTSLNFSGTTGNFVITVISEETTVYKSATVRYSLYIQKGSLQYLNGQVINSNIGVSGPSNTPIEVALINIDKTKNIAFNASEWTITASHWRCTPQITRIQETENYKVVMGQVSYSSEGNATLTIRFKGNDDFYSESYSINTSYIKTKLSPNLSFSNSYPSIDYSTGHKYSLQAVNNPNHISIDPSYWSSNKGTIKDNALEYDGSNENVIITLTIPETDNYLGQTLTYNLYINAPHEAVSPNLKWSILINEVDKADNNPYYPTLNNPNSVSPIRYISSNTDIASINSTTGVITLYREGSTMISAVFDGNYDYLPQTVSYTLNVTDSSHVKKNLIAIESYKTGHATDPDDPYVENKETLLSIPDYATQGFTFNKDDWQIISNDPNFVITSGIKCDRNLSWTGYDLKVSYRAYQNGTFYVTWLFSGDSNFYAKSWMDSNVTITGLNNGKIDICEEPKELQTGIRYDDRYDIYYFYIKNLLTIDLSKYNYTYNSSDWRVYSSYKSMKDISQYGPTSVIHEINDGKLYVGLETIIIDISHDDVNDGKLLYYKLKYDGNNDYRSHSREGNIRVQRNNSHQSTLTITTPESIQSTLIEGTEQVIHFEPDIWQGMHCCQEVHFATIKNYSGGQIFFRIGIESNDIPYFKRIGNTWGYVQARWGEMNGNDLEM